MSARAALVDGQAVELFGRLYTWRHENGRWRLEIDRLETPRRELTTALTRAAAQAQAQAEAARRAEILAALPPWARHLALMPVLARCAAISAGDVAYRPRPNSPMPSGAALHLDTWLAADEQPDAAAVSP